MLGCPPTHTHFLGLEKIYLEKHEMRSNVLSLQDLCATFIPKGLQSYWVHILVIQGYF